MTDHSILFAPVKWLKTVAPKEWRKVFGYYFYDLVLVGLPLSSKTEKHLASVSYQLDCHKKRRYLASVKGFPFGKSARWFDTILDAKRWCEKKLGITGEER